MRGRVNLKRDIKGQSLVEFALVLPILIILILGMVEFGWILNGKITITSAAREGARTAVIYKSPDIAAEAVENAVNKSAESSSLINVKTTTNFANGAAIVNVDAEIKPIVGLFFKENVKLKSKAEMKLE